MQISKGSTGALFALIAGLLLTPAVMADTPPESIDTLFEELAVDMDRIREAFAGDFSTIAVIAERIANHPKPSRSARWQMLRCAGPRQGLALGQQNAAVRDLAQQLAENAADADVTRAQHTFAELDAAFKQWHAGYQALQAKCQD